MIILKCSSCGGNLTIPDNLSIAHCVYCGAKILVTESDSYKNQLKLKSYLDICEVSIKSENYQEALEYSNKILEIDSNNFDGWIYKARASCQFISGNNPSEEAMGYLNKAIQINPNSPKIEEARKEINKSQAFWFFQLAAMSLKQANEIYTLWITSSPTKEGKTQAERKSEEFYNNASNYLLQAYSFDPDNMILLNTISSTVKNIAWYNWNDAIREKAKLYDKDETRK